MSKTETQSDALTAERRLFITAVVNLELRKKFGDEGFRLDLERDELEALIEMGERASRLDAENKALRARLEIDPSHPVDGIAARDETIRQLEAQMRALLGEMDAYALVPKEPSDAMRRAAQKADHDHAPHAEWLEDEWRGFRRVWIAMLAAAKTGDAA